MPRTPFMRHALALVFAAGLVAGLLMTAGLPAVAQQVQSVPSGQPISLHEAILEPQPDGTHWLRLRFVAPRLVEGAGQAGPEAAMDDMDFLCRAVGLPVVERSGRAVSRVVVSLASEAHPFGVAEPGITQYFEAYSLIEGDCIWEEF